MSSKKLTVWKFVFLVGIAICMLVVLVGLASVAVVFLTKSYGFNEANLPPANQSATPAANGFPQQLWPLGFESSVVKSVNVSYSTTREFQIENNVRFYAKECSQVQVDQVLLLPVSTYMHTPSYTRSAFNYLGSDYPLYTSGGNSYLTYTVATSGDLNNKSTSCALQLYLYDSNSPFSIFKKGLSPSDPYGAYVAKSDCLPIGHSGDPSVSTVSFNLSNTSLYYVGAAIYANVIISVNISGMVLEYNVSEIVAEECSLSPTVKSCTIPISSGAHNVCVLYESDNAFGTLMLFFDTQTTHWNTQAVTWLVILAVTLLLIAVLVFIVSFLACYKLKKVSDGYLKVNDSIFSEEAQSKPVGGELVT